LLAAVELRVAELTSARQDLERCEQLRVARAISAEDLQHTRDKVKISEAALSAAQQELAANRARVGGTTLAEHPQVRAAAALRDAYLAYARTDIYAPVAGSIAKRDV
jgi:membrane fusion protein (multidrug efflux system)